MQNSKKPMILVVDDEEGTRDALKVMFEPAYNVDAAKNANEALTLAGANNYAVVILDIMLPGMPGDKILAALKAMRPDAQVIMITALESRELFLKCVGLGAFAHIEKPFDNKVLQGLVEKAVAHSKTARQYFGKPAGGGISPKSFFSGLRPVKDKLNFNKTVREVEYFLIYNALKETNHNQSQAARLLGLSRSSLRFYLHELKIPFKRERRGRPKKAGN